MGIRSASGWEACSTNPPLQNRNRAAGWRCLLSGSPSLSQTWSGLPISKQIRDANEGRMAELSRRPAGIRSAPCRGVWRDAQGDSRSVSSPDSWFPDPLSLLGRSLGSVHVSRWAFRERTEPHRRSWGGERRRTGEEGGWQLVVMTADADCVWISLTLRAKMSASHIFADNLRSAPCRRILAQVDIHIRRPVSRPGSPVSVPLYQEQSTVWFLRCGDRNHFWLKGSLLFSSYSAVRCADTQTDH